MFSFLTDTEILLISNAVALAAGVVLSQKIKDLVKGVPSDVRSALSAAETNALAAAKQAQTEVLTKLLPAAAKPVVAPVTPAAPAAPAAPAVAEPTVPAVQ
jgi:hypothetical protein